MPNNEVTGAIRIAVRGRDRDGLVDPGDEYRELRGEITEALYELRDPATGRPVVKSVSPLHEICDGPFVGRLPDLAVLWDSTFAWNSLSSPRLGTLRIQRQDNRSGSHTPRSFLLAIGSGVPPGTELKGLSTYDIGPTVLEAAGVDVPSHLDGKPFALESVNAIG